MKVDSYSTSAQVPEVGSVWVWELGAAHARCLVRVVEVRWNGEEWWVKTEALAPEPLQTIGVVYNDASRFAEAVTPVGAAAWATHPVTDGVEFVVCAPSVSTTP
jgi:hypothetical protein